MDKNAIKKYAVWARRELISRVSQRAALYEITDMGFGDASADSVLGRIMSAEEKRQRQALIAQIREKGYEQVMEEIAYTWFNRFIALRFMEVNGYLPSRVRVFTDDENNFKPQILSEAINMELDGLDMEKVYALKNANDNDALFKYMIITQCNALSSILPGMFQRISDYTELLFPDNLLREGSVIEQMVSMIPEEDWTDQVQIIGWLYQYYNTEPKAHVFSQKTKLRKEDIPPATQLFTPDWIVRFLVQNSLGRLWLEGHPNDELKASWKYYLDEAEQEPDVQTQLAEIRKEYAALKPEDILAIDPCQGSGHILVYMFDVLVQIYESYGYTAREAAASIVEHNLWGIDIDDRAAQLAYFSVMMKARQYDARFFKRHIQPNIISVQESNFLLANIDELLKEVKLSPEDQVLLKEVLMVCCDAKEYGSILKFDNGDYAGLLKRWNEATSVRLGANLSIWDTIAIPAVTNLLHQAIMLSQKYSIVVTNPPYMGNMPDKMSAYVKKYYSLYRYDAYSVFISKAEDLVHNEGFISLVTGDSWLTLSSFISMRQNVLQRMSITSLLGLGSSAFESGFGTTAFVLRSLIKSYKGSFLDCTSLSEDGEKICEYIRCTRPYFHDNEDFINAPDSEVLYDASPSELRLFSHEALSKHLIPKAGIVVGNNDLYMRLWYEVAFSKVRLTAQQGDAVSLSEWIPLHKGGGYRKYYGIHEYVLHLQQMLEDKSINKSIRTGDSNYYFREGITWSTLSNKFGVRWSPTGFVYNTKGSMCFSKSEEQTLLLIGFLNSKVARRLITVLAPNLDFNSGTIVKLPYIEPRESAEVIAIVRECIREEKQDWDSSETSWDFQIHPLIPRLPLESEAVFVDGCGNMGSYSLTSIRMSDEYTLWQQETDDRFQNLKQAEEKLNRIFIETYGLGDELTPDVDVKDITIRKSDLRQDVRSFISYAVGCMFGRYSLDIPGLIYAGGDWDDSKYSTVLPDKDAIIPFCDDEYFEDDITGRFISFVRKVYGSETLEENLKFIAASLGGKGSPREVIRNYFINDFYADHLRMYQKRPIYWLFDSGKKNGFKCLIYMHRYQPDTIARIRTDYVHEQQSRYRTAIADLESRIANAGTSERVKLSKQLTKLQEQAEELRVYEEKIHHLADQMIRIDLDDGVKRNYAIFQDVLAKIK